MAVLSPSAVKVRIDHELIELDPAVHAMRVFMMNADTGGIIDRSYWVWHIRPEQKDGDWYCRMTIPYRDVVEHSPITIKGGIVCPECGLRGTIVKGHWLDDEL